MNDWIKNHKVLFALICVAILLLLIGVPFIINILFKVPAISEAFVAEWDAVMRSDTTAQFSPSSALLFWALWPCIRTTLSRLRPIKRLLLQKNRNTPKICLDSLCASAAPVDFAEV